MVRKWKLLERVPNQVHTVYEVHTIYFSGFVQSLDVAIEVLRNGCSVVVWSRHHVRGWERKL